MFYTNLFGPKEWIKLLLLKLLLYLLYHEKQIEIAECRFCNGGEDTSSHLTAGCAAQPLNWKSIFDLVSIKTTLKNVVRSTFKNSLEKFPSTITHHAFKL